ncbi:MAG: translation initiation factor IF-2 subunit beta [Candidatus Altiarchaeota archaeon]
MNSYKQLLERAFSKIPEKSKPTDRFEIPRVNLFIEGNQTIIKNFNDIVSTLRRDPKHISSFLSNELAAPALIDGNRLIIQRVLKAHMIDQKIDLYAKEFVLCNECKKPDTKIAELEKEKIIKCEACGAWRPLRKI